MKLLERLVAIQTSKNLSDREFARLLGVSNTTWSDIKKGDVTIGFQVIKGAVRELSAEYPALRNDVLNYLGTDDRPSPKPSSQTAIAV
jgi:transcriptional regulator with XRE-family HTH domain